MNQIGRNQEADAIGHRQAIVYDCDCIGFLSQVWIVYDCGLYRVFEVFVFSLCVFFVSCNVKFDENILMCVWELGFLFSSWLLLLLLLREEEKIKKDRSSQV